MKFALTGATGLLGSNLLLEIIKRNHSNLNKVEIIILGRDSSQKEIKKRITEIIISEHRQYLRETNLTREALLEFIEQKVSCINTHLDQEDLSFQSKSLDKLKNESIDYFFHIASLTDFRSTPEITRKLEETNVNGTKRILELIKRLKVGKFVYVSTAYACGKTTGLIAPDYVNLNQLFRNSYESSKLRAEILVRNFHKEIGINCQIFRPSTICGRLIETPIGATPKFDVFYSWAAFFVRYKQKKLNKHDCLDDPYRVDLRLCVSSESGLNIVPTDHVAKVMYETTTQNKGSGSFHVVGAEELPHRFYFKCLLESINVEGVEFVNSIPSNQNPFEEFYYKTVGSIFTPYITLKPTLFQSDSKDSFELTPQKFRELLPYPKAHNFGVR